MQDGGIFKDGSSRACKCKTAFTYITVHTHLLRRSNAPFFRVVDMPLSCRHVRVEPEHHDKFKNNYNGLAYSRPHKAFSSHSLNPVSVTLLRLRNILTDLENHAKRGAQAPGYFIISTRKKRKTGHLFKKTSTTDD